MFAPAEPQPPRHHPISPRPFWFLFLLGRKTPQLWFLSPKEPKPKSRCSSCFLSDSFPFLPSHSIFFSQVNIFSPLASIFKIRRRKSMKLFPSMQSFSAAPPGRSEDFQLFKIRRMPPPPIGGLRATPSIFLFPQSDGWTNIFCYGHCFLRNGTTPFLFFCPPNYSLSTFSLRIETPPYMLTPACLDDFHADLTNTDVPESFLLGPVSYDGRDMVLLW